MDSFKEHDEVLVIDKYSPYYGKNGRILRIHKDYCFVSFFGATLWVSFEHLSKKPQSETPSQSSGGSLRFNEGKPQFSHLSPHFIEEMMKVMTSANKKYPYLNYSKKQDVRTASDSLMRHFLAFQKGEDLDQESGQHHLAHVATNAMIIFQNLKDFGEEIDTRYEKELKKIQDEI